MTINIKGYDVLIDDFMAPMILALKWRVRSCSTTGMPYFATKIKIGHRKYKDVQLSRFIMGEPEGKLVDHRSGDTLDNRIANLRICTHLENNRNSLHKVGKSKFRNVVFDPKCKTHPYRTGIRINEKWVWRGHFATAEEAFVNHRAKAKEIFGEYYRETEGVS